MSDGLFERMDHAARVTAPVATTLVLVLVSIVPGVLPGMSTVAPNLPLMAVFYWSVYRPDLMPFGVVFLMGLLSDVLTGAPLGLGALTLLLAAWMVSSQRRFLLRRPFFIQWIGFCLVAAAALMVEWAAACLWATAWIDPHPQAFRTLLTAAIFPVPGWAFIQIHRLLVRGS